MKEADRELELEPDLLHPLASGPDVDRYAFRPLGDLLLFPYSRTEDAVALISKKALEGLDDLMGVLRENLSAMGRDPTGRAARERIGGELTDSRERIADLSRRLEAAEREADDAVFDLYEISSAQRKIVDAEYR